MWDLIAEREQERSSNHFSQHAHGREQVRALTAAKRPKLRHRGLWIAVRSVAKLLKPQQHR